MATQVDERKQKNFANKLWSLKNKRKFCDAAIIVGSDRIPVHAVVMATSSEYFEKAFENSRLPTKEVTLNEANSGVMQLLIEYCYTGILNIDEHNVSEVLRMASVYLMKEIIENFSEILEKNLEVSNSLTIWKVARVVNLEHMAKTALSMARKNFKEVSDSKEFSNLQFSDLNELLSSDVDVTSETVILDAIKKWINQNESSRNGHLSDLLEHVNLECLSKSDLTNYVSLCGDSNAACYIKFMNALQSPRTAQLKCARDSSENTLLAVGDDLIEKAKIMEMYHLVKEEWIQIPIELDKSCFFSVLHDNKLMTVGGSGPKNSAEYYDLITGEKESLPPMKHSRSHSMIVECNGHIYAIGGDNGRPMESIERWDPVKRSWKELAPMVLKRLAPAVVAVKNEIFVMGGDLGGDYGHTNRTDVYDTTTDTWTMRRFMHESRKAPGAAHVGNYIYVVGGQDEDEGARYFLKSAERYDYTNNIWTEIQSVDIPKMWLAAGNLNGQLVVAGGTAWNGRLSTVFKYDEENDQWEPMASLKSPKWVFNLIEVPWSLAHQMLSARALN